MGISKQLHVQIVEFYPTIWTFNILAFITIYVSVLRLRDSSVKTVPGNQLSLSLLLTQVEKKTSRSTHFSTLDGFRSNQTHHILLSGLHVRIIHPHLQSCCRISADFYSIQIFTLFLWHTFARHIFLSFSNRFALFYAPILQFWV